MPINSYSEALAFWFGRVNYEQRGMPADLRELKLDRMRTLLRRLGRPDEGLRVVHIAGSKGKGSTAAMLAAVLHQAGYRTGLFTSPHLVNVEERCQVDGQSITHEELTALMREIEPVVQNMDRQESTAPTFFEIMTALGFLHFARRRVAVAVLEVGLGGRFDATNVCQPLLSVITSISHDHTQELGPTLADIAREKAGIIKPGRPVISGATAPEARTVIQRIARAQQASFRELGQDFTYRYTSGWVTPTAWRWPRVSIRTRRADWAQLELSLLGEHQAANAAVAVACVEELGAQGLHIPAEAVRRGLRSVHWPARMEVVSRRPPVLLDCAHNGASIEALVRTLQGSFPPQPRVLVFASSKDKDLAGMVQLLVPHLARACFTRYTSSARSATPEELAALWQAARGGPAEVFAEPTAAWHVARQWAGLDQMVCITGSVFLAGELGPVVRAELNVPPAPERPAR